MKLTYKEPQENRKEVTLVNVAGVKGEWRKEMAHTDWPFGRPDYV